MSSCIPSLTLAQSWGTGQTGPWSSHFIEMLCTINQLQRDHTRMAVMSPVVPRWRQGCFWRHGAWKTTVTPSPHHPSLICMVRQSHSHSLTHTQPLSPYLAHFGQPLKLKSPWQAPTVLVSESYLKFDGTELSWPHQHVGWGSSFISFASRWVSFQLE